jgi:hypothetical protein
MRDFWLNTKLFFSLQDANDRNDPNLEAILLGFVRPALDHFKSRGWVEWYNFMGFSSEGYHVHWMCYGKQETLEREVAPYIRRGFASFRELHPEIMRGPMVLTSLPQVLNRKWGGTGSPAPLSEPGSVKMMLLPGDFDADQHESEEAWTAQQRFHTALCEPIFDFLSLTPTPRLRATFVRLLMADLLSLLDLTDRERYVILRRLQNDWIGYFELGDEFVSGVQAAYRRKARQFQQFFAVRTSLDDRLALLPAPARPVYRAWLACFKELAPALCRGDGEGRASIYDANRIIGAIHLTHNRLGVPLTEEVYSLEILAQHSGSRLAPGESQEIEAAGLLRSSRI